MQPKEYEKTYFEQNGIDFRSFRPIAAMKPENRAENRALA
jgi:hypothetical protein